MIRVNTAAIIQSALALIVAITIADTIRESIRWLGGGDGGGSALGVRIAVTILLIFAAIVILGQCGDHVLSICAVDTSHSTVETYLSNRPMQMMDCEQDVMSVRSMGAKCPLACSMHNDGHHRWCNACITAQP